MSALAEPRAAGPATRPGSASPSPPSPPRTGGLREVVQLLTVVLLVLASLTPLTRVFSDGAWVQPVAGGVLVAAGVCWGVRQLGGGGLAAMAASGLGWATFSAAVLAPSTTAVGVLPTRETLEVARLLLVDAVELIRLEAAPVEPGAALLLVAITGTWAVTTAACDAAFVRRLPLAAVALALVGFSVPLPLTLRTSGVALAVPFLAAAAAVLLAFGAVDLRRWAASQAAGAEGRRRGGGAATGAVMAVLAMGAGALLADVMPGFGDPPLYEVRGGGGTPTTDHPMVDLRSRLTAEDHGPVLEVTTDRPVYLRTTALDHYEDQRWTAETIRGTPIGADGALSPEVAAGSAEEITVEVEVLDLRGELVPVPYPPVGVGGPLANRFQHDPRSGTIILDGGEEIGEGDAYTVTAALPDPDEARLGATEGFAPDGELTELPDSMPDRVVGLAEQIVAEAGATTPFQQALALQEELQTWNYSLDPPQGHGEDALEGFLDTRTGYCEQFAATMAIMLRALDVPARVAVGFTPGTLVDPDEGRWHVSNGNAHAWTEVLFPGVGWLSFEPTPRADGNVLLPSAANVVPDDTVAGDMDPPDAPAARDEEFLAPGLDDPTLFPEDGRVNGADVVGAAGEEEARVWPWVVAGAVVLPAAVWLALALRRAAAPMPVTAGARIRRARLRAERLGHALGDRPRRADTDREFLTRLAGRATDGSALDAARTLARESARARYSREVPADAADRAESALATLTEAMPPPEGVGDRVRRALRLARTERRRGPR